MNLNRPIEWKIAALDLAIKTSPHTQWQPEPVYDYNGQLFALATMRVKFEDIAACAKGKITSAPFQWATTKRWPRLRNADAFFLKEALYWARVRCVATDRPNGRVVGFSVPPWSEDEARWLEAETVAAWCACGIQDWVESHARECFKFQEDFHRSMYPHE